MKKFVIGGLFIIGGVYAIKKLLPHIKIKTKNLELESESPDDVFNELFEERERLITEKREELQKEDMTRFGSYGGYARNSILQAYKKGILVQQNN